VPKRVLFFSVINATRLSATYPAPISTIFENLYSPGKTGSNNMKRKKRKTERNKFN